MLKDINLEIKKGNLCSIIGEVGSGKSSLFYILLNEMKKYEGKYGSQGKISYVEQQPFIFADTFRNNVLFGKEYEESRYSEIIKLCALETDLDQLPD